MKLMRRIVIMTLALLSLQSSTWAANPEPSARAGTSVQNVQTMKNKAAQRQAVLQQIASETETDLVLPAASAKATVRPAPRTGDGFARSLKGSARPQNAFAAMIEDLVHIYEPGKRVAILQAFVADHPDHRDARLHLARELMLSDMPARVLIALAPLTDKAQRRVHPDWQPWFWLGSAYLSLGEIDKAREHLDVAMGKDQTVAEIWLQLAIAEQAQENHAGALQYLQIAEQLNPDVALIYLNKAYSHERRGDVEPARFAYQRFLTSRTSALASTVRPAVVRHLAVLAESE